MDFGEILDKWEAGQKPSRDLREPKKSRDFYSGVDKYLPPGKDWDRIIREKEEEEDDPALMRSRLRRMPPEARIDLHGMDREEARTALDLFFGEASRRGCRKVLIVHGKGNHSNQGAVLPNFVRFYIQNSSIAGESGKADKSLGGSGATWVILKR
jgi:DNA-nicking Smr family endonuclease